MNNDYTQKETTLYLHRVEYDYIAFLWGQLFGTQLREALAHAIRTYAIYGKANELAMLEKHGFQGDDKRTPEELEKEKQGIFAAQILFPLIERLIDLDKANLREKGIIKEEEDV